jgi:DNA excision repair protein ERCC-8
MKSLPAPSDPRGSTRQIASATACLQWYPCDTGLFTSASRRGEVYLWDTNAFAVVATFAMRRGRESSDAIVYCTAMNGGDMSSAALRPLIAVGTNASTVYLCDPCTGDMCHQLLGHRDGVTAVEWSPSSPHLLASASLDGSLKLW